MTILTTRLEIPGAYGFGRIMNANSVSQAVGVPFSSRGFYLDFRFYYVRSVW